MQKKNPLRLSVLLAACAVPASGIAQVQFQTPNDNELHSAYCLSMLKSEIDLMQKELAKADAGAKSDAAASLPQELQDYNAKQREQLREVLAKGRAAHERIRAYLLPKIMVLDPAAMGLAMKRGEAD